MAERVPRLYRSDVPALSYEEAAHQPVHDQGASSSTSWPLPTASTTASTTSTTSTSLALARRAHASRHRQQGQDVTLLDLRGVTDMTDFFLIVSGTSDTHVRSLGEHIMLALKKRDRRRTTSRGWKGSLGVARLRRLCRARVSPHASEFLSARAPVGRRGRGAARARRGNGCVTPLRRGSLRFVCEPRASRGRRRAGRRPELFRSEPGAVRTGSGGRSGRPNTSSFTTTLRKPPRRWTRRAWPNASYARLSRILDHQFREEKPIVLFSSRTDFGQNNVTGDLGEGTGGVTEATRHRMLLNFTGDLKSFEHVLAHEMVHAFQYDIFARGKAGNGLQALAQYLPPLWFAEGMAEYLSLGPSTTIYDRVDARRGAQWQDPDDRTTDRPPRQILPISLRPLVVDVHRAKVWGRGHWADHEQCAERGRRNGLSSRELGISLEDLGTEWREDLQTRLSPRGGRHGSAAQIRATAPHHVKERRRDLPCPCPVQRRDEDCVSRQRQLSPRAGVHRPRGSATRRPESERHAW